MKYLLITLLLGLTLNLFSQTPTAQKLDKAMSIEKAESDNIIWLDSKKKPFELIGFEWFRQDSVFRRLPVNPKWNVPESVDQLANHTAGGQLHIRTNSNRILIKVELSERSGMYHMPATGQSGFDLYKNESGVDRYIKTTRFPHDTIQYQFTFQVGKLNKMHNYILNFPLYNGVKSLLIGIDKNSKLENPEIFSTTGKIVIYGTSITQGGCVSRPGMVYSNILSRKLGVEFINLGFSGNGKGEPELAHLINQISDIKLIILDYEANAKETIQNTIGPFIDILRKRHHEIPILIMSKTRYALATDGSEAFNLLLKNRDFQMNLIADRKENGDNHIYFLDGSIVLGEDYSECTVDGVHPSDLGSYRIAVALLDKINKLKIMN